MPITAFFTEAAKAGNERRVRDMMADSLIRDPLFEEFDEMLGEAGKFSLNLYVPYDGKPFNQDKTAWDKSYLDNLMWDLRSNFSRERVEHVKDVCRFIYKDKIKAIEAERRRMREERERRRAARSAYQQPQHSEQPYGRNATGPATASNSTRTRTGCGIDETEHIQNLSESAQDWYWAMRDFAEYVGANGDELSLRDRERLLGKLRKDLTEGFATQVKTSLMIKLHVQCVDSIINLVGTIFDIARKGK